MAEPNLDPSWLMKIADWISVAILGLVGWLYKHFDTRIEHARQELNDLRNRIPSDYERGEINRQRENITALFDGQTRTREMITDGFTNVNENLHQIHTSLLGELSKKADK